MLPKNVLKLTKDTDFSIRHGTNFKLNDYESDVTRFEGGESD